MSTTHVVGVDPGLVNTGLVSMLFLPGQKEIHVEHLVIGGPDTPAAKLWKYTMPDAVVFIEDYRPRQHYGSDARMTKAVQDFRRELGGTVLPNTAVKKVVKQPLMEVLGVWKFSTVTHHQDLRSAARIALLGMLKSEPMNALLTEVVRDHLKGVPWAVRS